LEQQQRRTVSVCSGCPKDHCPKFVVRARQRDENRRISLVHTEFGVKDRGIQSDPVCKRQRIFLQSSYNKSVSSRTLPVLRPTACICLPTSSNSTTTTATRCPRPCRNTSLPCSRRARPHSRESKTRAAVLGVQQALEEILQHLVLRLPSRTRCAAARALTTALHLG